MREQQRKAGGDGKSTASAEKSIEYLDHTYKVKIPAEQIVITGSVESMEDAKLLDVHPAGAISFSGKFPDLFKSITDKATAVGEKWSRTWRNP
ncbi:hypothetical protein PO124_26965 [Bacillus licheniformis]|nr:hypothetical protein [Bacillus licheniformis]